MERFDRFVSVFSSNIAIEQEGERERGGRQEQYARVLLDVARVNETA